MEEETLGDTLSDAQAMVDTLGTEVVVNTLNASQAEVEAETLGDTLSDAQAMVDTLADLRKHYSTRWLIRKKRWSQRR